MFRATLSLRCSTSACLNGGIPGQRRWRTGSCSGRCCLWWKKDRSCASRGRVETCHPPQRRTATSAASLLPDQSSSGLPASPLLAETAVVAWGGGKESVPGTCAELLPETPPCAVQPVRLHRVSNRTRTACVWRGRSRKTAQGRAPGRETPATAASANSKVLRGFLTQTGDILKA
jgi:hypothetical protein